MPRALRTAVLAVVPSLALAAGSLAQPPAAPAQDSHASAKARPPIYDEKTDGATLVNAAIDKAARNNRRVLVQWGANWCPWCHLLQDAMASDAGIKREVLYEYDVVLVDVGRFDRNTDLAAKYGADIKSGIPFLTVLDSSGKVVANQETGALESKEPGKQEHDRAAVLKFLKSHEATPRAAGDVLKDGLSRARTDHKRVFLHFGAPWCGWCHRLEAWMAKPEVAALLAKDFIDVKIDVDRDTGGKDVLARFNTNNDAGIPWFVFLDADGKVLASSHAAEGNIGFPAAPGEIAHFVTMLKAAKESMTDADIAALESSLASAGTH